VFRKKHPLTVSFIITAGLITLLHGGRPEADELIDQIHPRRLIDWLSTKWEQPSQSIRVARSTTGSRRQNVLNPNEHRSRVRWIIITADQCSSCLWSRRSGTACSQGV